MQNKKLIALLVPAAIVVALDQWTKYLIRTTPSLQNLEIIKGWLAFHYTQNPGMALGMEWATTQVISIVAILATCGILIYILKTMNQATIGYLVCMGLIVGGATGNIIDRLLMAQIQSYGGWLDGHVVDFIHFTLRIDGYPVFPYIFNVADVAITCAIVLLLIFHRRILPAEPLLEDDSSEADPTSPSATSTTSTTEGRQSSSFGMAIEGDDNNEPK